MDVKRVGDICDTNERGLSSNSIFPSLLVFVIVFVAAVL